MTFKAVLSVLFVLALTSVAGAQTKISGTAQCDKPDIQQQVEVPDYPGHILAVMQSKCTWSKSLEVGGVQDKTGVDSGVSDIHGETARGHGYYIDTMANGDKAFVHWEGTGSIKNGSSQGKWSYAGGTGKFKGLKGGGTYKGKQAEDGSVTFDVEGEYTLASK